MTTLGAPQPLAVPEHFRFEWDTAEEAMRPAGTVKLED